MTRRSTRRTPPSSGTSGAVSDWAQFKTTYGAVGDGVVLRDVAMTNASGVLTSASAAFTASDVGKTIIVDGAGGTAGNGSLVTTIASRQSATQVTLTASATATVSARSACYGTDDTAKLQAWIDANPTGGTLYVPEGIYMLSGAQVSGTSNTKAYSGQVVFPARNQTAERVTFSIVGPRQASAIALWTVTAAGEEPFSTDGAVFVSSATTGAIVDVKCGTGSLGTFVSNIEVDFTNVTFLAPNNPQCAALQLQYAGCAKIDGCGVGVVAESSKIKQPTGSLTGSIGINLPGHSNAAHVVVRDTQVSGFYVGLSHAEHATLDYVSFDACLVAIMPNHTTAVSHSSVYERVLIQRCQSALYGLTEAYLFGSLNIEATPAGPWWEGVWDVNDGSNKLMGQLWVHKTNTTAVLQSFTINGGRKLTVKSLSGGANVTQRMVNIQDAFGPVEVTSGASAATGASAIEYMLIVLVEPMVVNRMVFRVATQSGNVDVGIYDDDGTSGAPGTRLVSSGSTACPAAGAAAVTIADTFLPAGRYWAAIVCSNGTAQLRYGTTHLARGPGAIRYQETAFPLPATATPTVLANDAVFLVVPARV